MKAGPGCERNLEQKTLWLLSVSAHFIALSSSQIEIVIINLIFSTRLHFTRPVLIHSLIRTGEPHGRPYP